MRARLPAVAAMQFGPVLGGSLAQVNLRLPLFVAAALSTITLVLLIRYLEEPGPPAENRRGGASNESAGGTARGTRPLLLLLSASVMMMSTAMIVFLPVLLADRYRLGPNEIGLLQCVDGLMLLVGNQIFIWLSDRIGL
jgi:predicted MFS family arabinose efflux permease